MTHIEPKPALAIESAVGGGSIALYRGNDEIGRCGGGDKVSRAEDLIPNIERLLISDHVDRSELGSIVCSAGPGSFTGIRIGLATAMGLSASLKIPLRMLSLPAAIAVSIRDFDRLTVALSIGRDTVCVQSYSYKNGAPDHTDGPSVISVGGLNDLITAGKLGEWVAADAGLLAQLPEADRIVELENELAAYLGKAASISEYADVDAPIFAGKK